MFWQYRFIFDGREVRFDAGDVLTRKNMPFISKRLAFTRRGMGKNRRRLGGKDLGMWSSRDTARQQGHDDEMRVSFSAERASFSGR